MRGRQYHAALLAWLIAFGCAAPSTRDRRAVDGDPPPAGDAFGDPPPAGDTSGDPIGDDAGDDAGDPIAPPPSGCIEGDFRAYRGNLHAHTGYSDGEQDPAAAFAYARDVAGLDMMFVTDHGEQTVLPPPLDFDHLEEISRFDRCLRHARDASVAGTFLAGCGFEYGSAHRADPLGSTGHNNVFFSGELDEGLDPTVRVFGATDLDYHVFFGRLADCAPCLAQFNHPGDEPTQTWDDFTFEPEVADELRLFELNGNPTEAWRLLFVALDQGWTVGPVLNQDNHGADWGTRNDSRSGFFMASLDEAALKDAMGHARVFASTDLNAEIRLVADEVCWMGSLLSGTSSVDLLATASDPDVDAGLDTLELYGPGGELVTRATCATENACEVAHTLSSSAPTYVLARANYTDGGYLVSAPIWLSP